jgi:hypothetical protein
MYRCVICHFEVPMDDTVISGRTGCCICLRCYIREAGVERPMTPGLRRDVSSALGAIAGAE